jgi:3',5'-cyclic AMP phosphodiesterase CpdA
MVGFLCGCGDDADDAPFRVVLIADTHIIGPQYECCTESTPADNASIVQTVDRLRSVSRRIGEIEPPPDLVIVLGDVLHDAHHERDSAWYEATDTAWSVARDLFAEFPVPVHFVWGNHDYQIRCDNPDRTYDRELSHDLMAHFFEQPPYQSIDRRGFRFILANGQLGPTWEPGHPLCNTSMASDGPEQLQWIDDLLADGMPTFLLMHHMRIVTQVNEDPEGPHPDVFTLAERHPNTEAVVVGHTHRWMDLTAINSGIPHYVVAATRYDDDNFWLLEMDPRERRWRILDRDKAIWLNSCAQTWTYVGTPMPVPGAPLTGDCVMGLE